MSYKPITRTIILLIITCPSGHRKRLWFRLKIKIVLRNELTEAGITAAKKGTAAALKSLFL